MRVVCARGRLLIWRVDDPRDADEIKIGLRDNKNRALGNAAAARYADLSPG